ncbi:hypothetical protein MKW94_007749 [Papaver nudicaule]|uniref:Uncharacterized protein n=1 Tax=Papaver nudicaule TaxID=74823 RepID=A0AA41RKP7_PAPNU|nr:hypothetical protein [Papaver nudicaule]
MMASSSQSSSSKASSSQSSSNNEKVHPVRVPVPSGFNHSIYIDKNDPRFLIKSLSKPSSTKAMIDGYIVVGFPKSRMVLKGKYTMHIDGSYIGKLRGGFGVVIRNSDRKLVAALYGCSTAIFPDDPQAKRANYHELEAAFYGFLFCGRLNIACRDVQLITDCKAVVQIFDDKECIPNFGKDVETLCERFTNELGFEGHFKYNIHHGAKHVYRQANWPADSLSKLGMYCEESGEIYPADIEDGNPKREQYGPFVYFLERDEFGDPYVRDTSEGNASDDEV